MNTADLNFDIRMDKKDAEEIQSALKTAAVLFSPDNMKKLFYGIGVVVQSDVKENFKQDKTFDDEKMPGLLPETWERKHNIAKRKKPGTKVHNPNKLYETGLLQKVQMDAKYNQVSVYSPAPYALALNDRKKYGPPFKFMGFGKRVLGKITVKIKEIIWNGLFK